MLARLHIPLVARWERNLFVHFRVPTGAVRAEVPPGIEVDPYDGDAWISALVRSARGPMPLPPVAVGLVRPHAELLLAICAVRDGEPGHYVLSYTVPSFAVALAGRALLGMPLSTALLRYTESPDGELALRVPRRSGLGEVALRARPQREPLAVRKSPLATFLLERYSLFAGGRDGRRLETLRFDHRPWKAVEAAVSEWNIPFLARFELPWGGAPDAVYVGTGVSVRFRDIRSS